jgi:hypothetical protein
MMGRAPRPADSDIRRRLAHVIGHLRAISESSGPLDARDAWLAITLAMVELQTCLKVLRRSLP